MSIQLRPYQTRATTELLDWFIGNEGNPILDAAVGSGKSVMLAWLCEHALTTYPGTRIIMLVPSRELLTQNLEKLIEIWPTAPVGIMSAAAGKKQLGYPITIATIGTLYKHAHNVGHVDLIIVDECHLIPGGEMGMYRQFFADLRKYCPDFRVIGATGTPFRGNGEWLTAVEQPLFHDIACRVTMDELLASKYLAPLTTLPTVTQMDASGVRTSAGDYVVSELAKAIDRPHLVTAACAETVKLAADRKKWLLYCVTVEHARHVALELQSLGIACDMVTGETPKAERAELIERFRTGELRALVSVAVLTTGFNVPDVDCIVLLRNTQSPVLYVQIMGRGMRIADGKTDCLVLDFTDTIERLGPVNKVKGRLPKKTKGEAPVKVCDSCGTMNPISAATCKMCGAPFPVEESAPHSVQASTALVLDVGKPRLVRYEISEVRYAKHQKPGKPDSLRVEYWSGMRRVASEWVCLDHDGYAQARAFEWLVKRWTSNFLPMSVSEAVSWINERYPTSKTESGYQNFIESGHPIADPIAITINESEKYPSITKYEWAQEAVEA